MGCRYQVAARLLAALACALQALSKFFKVLKRLEQEEFEVSGAAVHAEAEHIMYTAVDAAPLENLELTFRYLPVVMPRFVELAQLLLAWWRRPEAQPAAALEAAQAAAARSCAYLRCANLGGEGGPAAGQGAGSQRCRWAAGIVGRDGGLTRGAAARLTAERFIPSHGIGACPACQPAPLHLPMLPLQRMPRGVVLRHRLFPRRLAGRAQACVPGAGRGTGGEKGAAAAGCGCCGG